VLVIRDMSLDFRKPARLDDELQVSVVMTERRSASLLFEQQIVRGDELLVGANVRVACLVASSFRPRPLPEWLGADRP
jgi:acyl-CoA thioester hydrolase